ncbi:hypothetical protein FACS1894192_00780 [Bacilli bacterium]|nr:hypothetical protein FACS1894192_00780 [Bacilli bacterium]
MDRYELQMRALNGSVQMIEEFDFFEQKILAFKRDLYLSPYAKINEILAWCELLIKYESQIDLLCNEAKYAIQEKMNKINPSVIESHFTCDEKTLRVWSNYVLELLELDRRYQDVVYQFCVSIDNCVRYLVSYSNELAEYGFNLPQIMVKVRDLGTFHWLNQRSKAQLLNSI